MKLTIKAEYLIIAAALLAVFGFATFAHANPFYTGVKAQSALASSTVSFLGAGLGTSTTVYDSYEQYGTNEPATGNITIPDGVVVMLSGNASSSATVVNMVCEYSDNYNPTTGYGDWFQNESFVISTTGIQTVTLPVSFAIPYATSTIGGLNIFGSSSTAPFRKMIPCATPVRFVRAVVSATGAGANVWTQIIPKKQRNSGN